MILLETVFIIGAITTLISIYRTVKTCRDYQALHERRFHERNSLLRENAIDNSIVYNQESEYNFSSPLLERDNSNSVTETENTENTETENTENTEENISAATVITKNRKRNKKNKKGINFKLSDFSIITDIECSICLEPFELGEVVKNLKCSHIYHVNCVEKWFKKNETCPLCRTTN